MPTNNQNK